MASIINKYVYIYAYVTQKRPHRDGFDCEEMR